MCHFTASERRYCDILPSKQAELLVRASFPALISSITPPKSTSQADFQGYALSKCLNHAALSGPFLINLVRVHIIGGAKGNYSC